MQGALPGFFAGLGQAVNAAAVPDIAQRAVADLDNGGH